MDYRLRSCRAVWIACAVLAGPAAACGDENPPAESEAVADASTWWIGDSSGAELQGDTGKPADVKTDAKTDAGADAKADGAGDAADGSTWTDGLGEGVAGDTAQDAIGDVSALSCQGRCGVFDATAPCQCNTACTQVKSCCPDYAALCAACSVAGQCDDGDACTIDDCAQGACTHTADPTCCKVDGDCPAAGACSVAKCMSGKCSAVAKPGCCSLGECCDFATGQIQPAGTPCGSQALAIEYACAGSAIQQRDQVAGCDGQMPELCSQDAAFATWTPWKSVSTCDDGAACVPAAPGQMPTCAGGVVAECLENAACDDGVACTADKCVNTKCQHLPATAGTACGTKTVKSEYKCADANPGSDVLVRHAVAGCDGSAAMACSDAKPAWGPWQKAKDCNYSEVCKVADPTQPGTCVAKPACTPATVCCDSQGQYAVEATPCGKATVATEYKCDSEKPGGKVLVRKAVAGCTGYSTYCSSYGSSMAWGPWETHEACGQFETCDASYSTSLPGTCESPCTPGSTCCTADGIFAPQATKCGSYALDTEHKCSGPEKGGKILVRKSYSGCSGASTSCSSLDENLAWTDWSVEKTCTASQVCELDSWGSATCASALKCTPGAKCCTADGTYAPKGEKCGTYAVDTEYKCASTAKGGAILQREAFDGCSGTSTSCSWATGDQWWSEWKPYKTCTSTEVCEVSLSGSYASCKSAIQCTPGAACCTAEGAYAAKGEKCGTYPQKTEYKCSDPGKGASIQKREGFSGCSGTSTYCSYSSADTWWSDWVTDKACSANQYCSVTYPSSPGMCTATPP